MWAVRYLKRVRTGRGNKQSLQPIRKKTNSWMQGFPRTVACFFQLFRLSHSLQFPPVIGSTVIRIPLTANNVIDFLCEKLVVTYQICSFLFSARFVDTMSKALQIPQWRLFNIRTEEGDEEGCLIVKFGIIGTGIL